MLIETIRSRAVEGRAVSLGDVRGIAVPLYASLAAATPTGNPQYRVPMNDFLVIRRILAHIGLATPSTENMQNAGVFTAGNATSAGLVLDHMIAKAANCRMVLRVTDDDYTILGTNHALTLNQLMRFGGGGPIDYRDTPLRVRPGRTLELTLALNDVVAAAVGQATEYGVLLVGALVRRTDRVKG